MGGHLKQPNIQALIHGLNRHYYSMVIGYRKNELEEQMLMNLHKKRWTEGLETKRSEDVAGENARVLREMSALAKSYHKRVVAEGDAKTGSDLVDIKVSNVGSVDPRKHLQSHVEDVMALNIVQCMGTMLGTVV